VGRVVKGRCTVCPNVGRYSFLPRRNPGSQSKTLNCRRESLKCRPGTGWHLSAQTKRRTNQSVTALISWQETLSSSDIMHAFYFLVTVHSNKFLYNKTNRRTNFPDLFLSRNSTCFGQFLCPSSGVFHCTFGTGICHAFVLESCHQICMTYTSAECTVENS